ncbi:MAG: asparaginase [Thermoanaerobaculia bacterium]
MAFRRRGRRCPRGASGRLPGDPQVATFLRSAAKPFQCVPLLLAGVAERYGLEIPDLALICANSTRRRSATCAAWRWGRCGRRWSWRRDSAPSGRALTPQPLSPIPPPTLPGREGPQRPALGQTKLTSPSSPRPGWVEGWEKRAGVMRANVPR